jgi:DNA-binding CsgD family transcriptional regulator
MGVGGHLVGRDSERAMIGSLLRGAAQGSPSALLLTGEPGIGKTSLVAEATSGPGADGQLVLWGRCLRFGAHSSPYLPIAQALTHWYRQAEPAERERVLEGAGHLATIAPSLGTTGGPADLARIIPLVATVLDRIAALKPVVVVVDDVQWADGTSLDVLAYLMAGFGTGQRLSLLITYRDTGLGDGHRLHGWLADVLRLPSVSRLRLDRLGMAEIEELIAGLHPGAASVDLATEVFERSGGNPYLAELLARSPRQEQQRPHQDGLDQALLGSWHRLAPEGRELLQLLAVGGRPVAVPVLRRLVTARGHDPAAVDAWLGEAYAESLVTVDPEDQAWFHHPLVADVVAATVTPSERVEIHRQYVAALEPDEELSAASRAALLALHHHGGRHADQAFTWSLRAADAAAGVLAFAEEFDHLHRACRLWDQVGDNTRAEAGPRTGLLVRAGDSAWRAGQHLLAVHLREQAIAVVDPDTDPVLAVRLRLPLHHRRVDCGLERGPDVATKQAVVELAGRCAGTVEHCIALAQLAFAERWAGHPSAAADAETAVRMAQQTGSPEALAWALGVRSQTRPAARAGLADAEQSLALAGQVKDPELLGNIAIWRANCLLTQGRLRETADSLVAAFRDLVATGSVHDAMWAQPGWAARILIDLGRWDEARAMLRELLSHRLAPLPAGDARASAALLAFRSGDEQAGRAHLARARELGPERGGPGDILEFVEVEAKWAGSDHQGALTQLAAMLPPLAVVDPDGADEALALAARVAGDLSERPAGRADAVALLTRIEELRGPASERFRMPESPETKHPVHAAVFRAERARCHGEPATADLWEAALTACTDAALVWDQALVSYRLARALLIERGSRSRAAAALRDAHRIARDLGALPLLADVAALARQTRIPLSEPGSSATVEHPTTVGASLTSREREVLSHVVAGRTYAEIATALFISEKTVSVHVSNLLRKTGTSSRIELADLARRS